MSDKHYFTGEQCRRGHVAPRLKSNRACTECEKLRDRSNQNTGKIHPRWWTKEELEVLKRGESLEEIAKETGRSASAVYQRAYKSGRIWGSGGIYRERRPRIVFMKNAFDLINRAWR